MLGKEYCAVLRSNGERTAKISADLLREQFKSVKVIQIQPFSEAVKECYRIAIKSRAKWLVTCDADVLIVKSAWKQIRHITNEMLPEEWQALGQIYDKLTRIARKGGMRIHRVSMLHDKIDQVSNVIRPEANLCIDHPNWAYAQIVLGIHDYGQWYSDLYRKGSAHRIKHSSWERKYVNGWRASEDRDIMAALRGWDGEPLLDWTEKKPIDSAEERELREMLE